MEPYENSPANECRIYSGRSETLAGVNITASNIWDNRARVVFSVRGSQELMEEWMNLGDSVVFGDTEFRLADYHHEVKVTPGMTGGGRSWVLMVARSDRSDA